MFYGPSCERWRDSNPQGIAAGGSMIILYLRPEYGQGTKRKMAEAFHCVCRFTTPFKLLPGKIELGRFTLQVR